MSGLKSFLDDTRDDSPFQFRHLATNSSQKLVQALLPFWRLVTLLVQCKLLVYQGSDEGSIVTPTTRSPTATNGHTPQDLRVFLPQLFVKLESIRINSVPPAARILHTQVLRSMGDVEAAVIYLESEVLPLSLETDAFMSDSDEANEDSNGKSQNGNGNRCLEDMDDSTANSKTPNGKPSHLGTPRNNSIKGRIFAKNKKNRANRILSWTPKTTLSAIDLYIKLCFESAALGFSTDVAPAADYVTSQLQRAEERCIDFINSHSSALGDRLRPCFATGLAAPSVYDEMLGKVEAHHEWVLQQWNRQCMSHATNPTTDAPDTPPFRPSTPTEELAPTSLGPQSDHRSFVEKVVAMFSSLLKIIQRRKGMAVAIGFAIFAVIALLSGILRGGSTRAIKPPTSMAKQAAVSSRRLTL